MGKFEILKDDLHSFLVWYIKHNNLDGKEYREISSFTDEEKKLLRPIAEVFSMLDGNAFLTNTFERNGITMEWYEQYLPEAWEEFQAHGGKNGWAGEASWIKGLDNGHDV